MTLRLPKPAPSSSDCSLQRATALLATADDHSWDELLPLVEHLEHHDLDAWQTVAVATLETMVARNACEALGRDPWSSVAPLMTCLLHGLASHTPQDPRRAVRAVHALFTQLSAAEPITWPDGLPGAVASLAACWDGFGTELIAGFAQTVDRPRLLELLTCKRTTRRELRSLRCIAADGVFVEVIDAALKTAAR